MANNIESKLQGLGIELPNAPNPGGSYIPYVIVDSLVFISSQLPRTGGKVAYPGKLGSGLSIEEVGSILESNRLQWLLGCARDVGFRQARL